jgi:hypothetical protein
MADGLMDFKLGDIALKSLHYGSIIIAFMILVVSIACAGEQGPPGVQGPAGPAGPQGEPGAVGPSGFEALQSLQAEGDIDAVTAIYQEAMDGWNAVNREYRSLWDISEVDVALRRLDASGWFEKFVDGLDGVSEPPVIWMDAHNHLLAVSLDMQARGRGRHDVLADAGTDFSMAEFQNDPALGKVVGDTLSDTWIKACEDLTTTARKTVFRTSFAFCP